MKSKIVSLILLLLVVFASCTKDGSFSSSDSAITSASGTGPGNGNQPGVITAGEWNDLQNWNFWDSIMKKDNFKSLPAYWKFFNTHRISVSVTGTDAKPVVNAVVKLKKDGAIIFTTKTDNTGSAELWADLFQDNSTLNLSGLTIDINNGAATISSVKSYSDGINKITISAAPVTNKLELAFVVDATGSMGDELEFLKTELLDVINRVKNDNPNSAISTSSVFYRDKGDDYVTRVSNFSSNISTTIDFIKKQSAGGGGDIPEAVHSALDKAVNELQWSATAKTRLLFLILDAPPHYENSVINNIQASIKNAAEKGIKIIPITASGIDKETEFLMRFIAMSTNGTYVFITNHSGIGNNHLEATVGPYQVEYLNNLMVRLINKYAQ